MTIRIEYRIAEEGTQRQVLFGVGVSLRGAPRVGDWVSVRELDREVEKVIWYEDDGPLVVLKTYDPGNEYAAWCEDCVDDGWEVIWHGGSKDGSKVANWVDEFLATKGYQDSLSRSASSVGAGRPAAGSGG